MPLQQAGQIEAVVGQPWPLREPQHATSDGPRTLPMQSTRIRSEYVRPVRSLGVTRKLGHQRMLAQRSCARLSGVLLASDANEVIVHGPLILLVHALAASARR